MSLDNWTPGHKPSRLIELPTGGYELTWTRFGLPDAVQWLSHESYVRLRRSRTLPPIEQESRREEPVEP